MNRSLNETCQSHNDTRFLPYAAIQLRPYQEELIQGIYEAWASSPKVMAQLPTGGGKTVVFAQIAAEFSARKEQVLVLVHREELLTQAVNKLQAQRLQVGTIKAGYPTHSNAPIQVGSVQSLVNRLRDWESFSLIIIDEAHHATAPSYRKILKAFPDTYVLGVSATPIRTDGTGFDDLFDELVCGPTVSQLTEQGYLSPCRLYAAPNPMVTKGIRTQTRDFSASGLAARNDAIELSGNLISAYQRWAFWKQTIVFAINVAHSREIAARYQTAGIRARHLDGSTSAAARSAVLEAFRRGEIQVLTNCSLFGEGLDIPGIEAVQIARPTKSLALWLQMVGRGLRPSPGKDHAIVLDHTNNWAIHGLPTRPRLWTLEGVKQPQKRQARTRPDGQVVEVEPVQILETSTALNEVELTPEQQWNQTYKQLLKQQVERGYREGWVYHQLVKLRPPIHIWRKYEKLRGYKRGWAQYRFNEQQRQQLGGAA